MIERNCNINIYNPLGECNIIMLRYDRVFRYITKNTILKK